MFESESSFENSLGSVDNVFVLGYMSCSRTREIDKRLLGERVACAWQQFQEAEITLAASIAAWDDAGAWAIDGALSPSAWLRHRLGLSYSHAVEMLQFARGLSSGSRWPMR